MRAAGRCVARPKYTYSAVHGDLHLLEGLLELLNGQFTHEVILHTDIHRPEGLLELLHGQFTHEVILHTDIHRSEGLLELFHGQLPNEEPPFVLSTQCLNLLYWDFSQIFSIIINLAGRQLYIDGWEWYLGRTALHFASQ